MKSRPFGVTVLAILAGIAAVLAGCACPASAGDLSLLHGRLQGPALSFWSFLM